MWSIEIGLRQALVRGLRVSDWLRSLRFVRKDQLVTRHLRDGAAAVNFVLPVQNLRGPDGKRLAPAQL